MEWRCHCRNPLRNRSRDRIADSAGSRDGAGHPTRRAQVGGLVGDQVREVAGQPVRGTADGRVKFGDLARAWLDSKHNLKRSTRARYESTLTVALTGFRDVAIADISRQMVRALVADLVNVGAAASSVHKTVGLLRQVLAAGEHKALVYVLGTTGLRFGEAAELRWRDVDFAGLRLRVTRSVTFVGGQPVVGTPKNGKDRTVALPATVAALLTPGLDDALVFPDSAGGWMRGSNVRRRWWAKALSDAGLPTDFKLHELRHTAASLAIRSGANIKRCRTCWATPRPD
ncbi:MAG: site-specific integrase [Mycobacterium sp.]